MAGGGGSGGMNWEIGIDMYTLMCIKWITNKNLLYKKINKIKFKTSKKEKGKGYILYDSNYVTFWKRQNYGDNKKIRGCQGFRGK